MVIKLFRKKQLYLFQITFLYYFKKLTILKETELPLIEEKWKALNLPIEKFKLIVQLGGFSGKTSWLHFMAISCSTISHV